MIKWLIVFAVVGLFVGGMAYVTWQNAQPQIQPRPTPTYPPMHEVPPNVCIGTYDNNVAVGWPAVDGRC